MSYVGGSKNNGNNIVNMAGFSGYASIDSILPGVVDPTQPTQTLTIVGRGIGPDCILSIPDMGFEAKPNKWDNDRSVTFIGNTNGTPISSQSTTAYLITPYGVVTHSLFVGNGTNGWMDYSLGYLLSSSSTYDNGDDFVTHNDVSTIPDPNGIIFTTSTYYSGFVYFDKYKANKFTKPDIEIVFIYNAIGAMSMGVIAHGTNPIGRYQYQHLDVGTYFSGTYNYGRVGRAYATNVAFEGPFVSVTPGIYKLRIDGITHNDRIEFYKIPSPSISDWDNHSLPMYLQTWGENTNILCKPPEEYAPFIWWGDTNNQVKVLGTRVRG